MAGREAIPANWAELPDEELLDLRLSDLPLDARGHGGGDAHRAAPRRARGARPRFPASLLPLRRVVHAGRRRRRWRCRSTSRTRGSSGSRRRRCWRSKAASTSGACASCATRPATSSTTPTSCACGGSAARCSAARRRPYPEFYAPKPVQQELRPAPRSVVRAEPSRRGLRRDVRGVADAGIELADALCGLAGDQEARVHGRADAVAASASRRCVDDVRRNRSAAPAQSHACAVTTDASAATTASITRRSTIATCGGCSPTRRSIADRHDRGAVPRPPPARTSAGSSPTGPASTSTRSTRSSKT